MKMTTILGATLPEITTIYGLAMKLTRYGPGPDDHYYTVRGRPTTSATVRNSGHTTADQCTTAPSTTENKETQ